MGRWLCYARRFRFAQVQKGPVVASSIILNVDVRTANGSGGARAARRAEKVPGVLYGGPRGPVSIEIEKKLLVKALRSGKFISHMVTLEHKGEQQPVIPKAIQYHPVTEEPLHFDLYRVEETSIIDVEVPVRFINHDLSPGLKAARPRWQYPGRDRDRPDRGQSRRRDPYLRGDPARGRAPDHQGPGLHRRYHRRSRRPGRGRSGLISGL
jgi:ribosomal protein L25 (general stress protein Ctc)